MKNRPLYNAFNKYGIEHFSIHLIEECDENILGEREKYWIKYYNSKENGYNATLGGDGSTLYDYDEIYFTPDKRIRNPNNCQHESDYGRWNRYVWCLPSSGWR